MTGNTNLPWLAYIVAYFRTKESSQSLLIINTQFRDIHYIYNKQQFYFIISSNISSCKEVLVSSSKSIDFIFLCNTFKANWIMNRREETRTERKYSNYLLYTIEQYLLAVICWFELYERFANILMTINIMREFSSLTKTEHPPLTSN